MRLTLRTLLAYLDGILDPKDADELRGKIEDSDFAKGLVHRIQSANARSRLGAPAVDGKGVGLDPNTVAEYLDNVSLPDRVPDLERICLESDVHLAEVASCHQILAIVLGQTANVDPGLRERIYRIGSPDTERTSQSAMAPADLSSSGQFPPEQLAAEGSALGGLYEPPPVPVVPPPVEPSAEASAPAVRRSKAVVPEYLRAGQRSHWKPLVITLTLAFLLSAVALRAMGPFDRHHPLLRLVGGRATPVVDDSSSDRPGVMEDTVPLRDDSPDDQRPTDPLVSKPATTQDGAVIDDPVPTEERLPDDPDREAIADPATALVQPLEPGFPTTQPQPVPPTEDSEIDADWPLEPQEPDMAPPPANGFGQPVEVGFVKIKDLQFPIRYDAKTARWYRLPARSKLFSGDRLRVLPTFHPEIVLTPGVQFVFAGPSSVRLTPPTPQGEPTLDMEYGRAFISTAGIPGARLHLNMGERSCVVTFLDAASEIALETRTFLPLGAHPERDATQRVVRVFPTIGRVEWQDDPQASPVPVVDGQVRVLVDASAETVAAGDLPPWISREDLREIDRGASAIMENSLQADRPITLSLRERMQDRRTEVRSLAAISLAHLDVYDALVADLDDPRQRAHWAAEFEALRSAMARNPESAAAVRREFERRFPEFAEQAYRLLFGFSPQQLSEGADESLVRMLDHPSQCVRVLAFENLRRITGLTLLYRPYASDELRRSSVRGWRDRLDNRSILYDTLPSATSDRW